MNELHLDGDAARATPLRRLSDGRWILGVAIGLAVIAHIFYAVPLLAAFVGVGLVIVVVALGPRRQVKLKPSLSEDAGVLWPDTGMKSVVDAMPDPCFIVDLRGVTRYANAVSQERFPMVKPGDPLSFGLRAPTLLEALDRVMRGGGAERIEWSEKVPTELWLQTFIAPVRPLVHGRKTSIRSKPKFVLVSVHDLTEQRRLERMRADFVANASHELRTPLASLTGFIETLQGPAREDEAARGRFLEIMLEQAERMGRLIDDLLSLSRIELRAHVHPEEVVDLNAILRHVTDSLQPMADELNVEISSDLPEKDARIRGERDELIEVFENLLENALKYGASGEKVEICCQLNDAAKSPGCWVVQIRDYGPGIALEHLPRLTERFYRVNETPSREMKGTGLGLAIVKHILTRHRAKLEIESAPGEGARFRVRFTAVE